MTKFLVSGFSVFVLIMFFHPIVMGHVSMFVDASVEMNSYVTLRSHKRLEISFELRNKSDKTIYIATNPVHIDKTPGYYVFVEDAESESVTVSSRLFAPLLYSPYSVHTNIELRKLEPNQLYSSKIILRSPLSETIPPKDLPLIKKQVDLKLIKRIKLQIAYFSEDEGLVRLLHAKRFGWFLNGNENLISGKWAGKRIFEIQEIVTSEIRL